MEVLPEMRPGILQRRVNRGIATTSLRTGLAMTREFYGCADGRFVKRIYGVRQKNRGIATGAALPRNDTRLLVRLEK